MTDLLEKFIEGELVRLRAGSPVLTVEDIATGDLVSVVWFEGGEVRRDTFHRKALLRSTESEETPA